jgi:hypothetical protein
MYVKVSCPRSIVVYTFYYNIVQCWHRGISTNEEEVELPPVGDPPCTIAISSGWRMRRTPLPGLGAATQITVSIRDATAKPITGLGHRITASLSSKIRCIMGSFTSK